MQGLTRSDKGGISHRDFENQPIIFRNYTPQTNLLEGLFVVEKSTLETITARIEDKLKLISEETNCDNKYQIDKVMLEPQKVDSDLKRLINPRLDKLERETRKQIDKFFKMNKGKR